MFGLTKRQIFGYLILFYMTMDLLIFFINILVNTGDGGCGTEDWFSSGLIINNVNNPFDTKPCDKGAGSSKKTNIGRWKSYLAEDNKCLYEAQINTLVSDIKNNYKIDGYTTVELLAYIIIPTITFIAIGYWVISTRASKAEWTFWILIITLIYTGLTTVVQETSGIDLVPSQPSCLDHVTSSLGFNTGDELTYSFMARKEDGTKCFIEGTYLGTPEGGVESPTNPPVYNGDSNGCSSDALPLY